MKTSNVKSGEFLRGPLFKISQRKGKMNLTEAKTEEEIKAAIAEEFPEEIEFEPGKIAHFDPASGNWIYQGPDGTKVILSI